MRVIIIRTGDVINLGRQGENNALQVRFCVSGWAEAYGAGTYSLTVQTPGSSDTYDATVTESGDQVLWTVPQIVTLAPGQGFCQLSYHVGGGLAKSEIFRTIVTPSVGPVVGPISDSEAWAVGERDGVPVPEDDPTYHNNSKYYAEAAHSASLSASSYANSASSYADSANQAKRDAQEAYNIALRARDEAEQAAQQAALYVGAPLVAATAADMTDHERIYVYTGSETGYTYGDWYYWNGSAWADGGVYNSSAIQTDPTLSIADMPADAKVTGDRTLAWYSPGTGNALEIANMPRGSYAYKKASMFTDLPEAEGTPGDSTYVYVERKRINEGGNLSIVTCMVLEPGTTPRMYLKKYSETTGTTDWTRVASKAELDAAISAQDTKTTKLAGDTLKQTINLYDRDNPTLLNGYINTATSKYAESNFTRTIVIPVKPDTYYVVSRPADGYYAWSQSCSATIPSDGDVVSKVSPLPSIVTINGRNYGLYKTTSDAQYLLCYVYNSNNHDAESILTDTLAGYMVTEGQDYTPFRPYKSTYVNYNEQEPIKQYGIFGIKFTRNAQNPAVQRTHDAVGLRYRQQTGETVEKSDFDNCFPWSDMRECNIVAGENGVESVTYKGESGYDPSGNVYVEVPAFYFKRIVHNGVEEWDISGTPFSGAELEPWFIEADGSTVPYRYIGKYEGADGTDGALSVSGVAPKTTIDISDARTLCETYNNKLMTATGYLALSHLMAIECGTLNLQHINTGISMEPYYYDGVAWAVAQETATGNTVVVPTEPRWANIQVGDTIYIGDSISSENRGEPHKVTSITMGETTVTITFDGAAYAVVAGTTKAYPQKQPTGMTDGMTYYCGRPSAFENNGAFQYRGIENPYGNVWEWGDGITWSPTTEKLTIGEDELSYTTPTQDTSGADGTSKGFIKTLGFDRSKPWATLPETVIGSASAENVEKYISDEWSTPHTSGRENIAFSGGWDHQHLNGAFVSRATWHTGGWLYGFRAMV